MGEAKDMKRYTHLTEQDVSEAKELEEALKKLDPFARRLVLERVKGINEAYELMKLKTA
jgi:hypothetical protein